MDDGYNKMQFPPVIEKRTAVGSIPNRRNVSMTAVLCNGVTIAQFLSEDEADRYIALRFPKRTSK